jgi:hypothetical protein
VRTQVHVVEAQRRRFVRVGSDVDDLRAHPAQQQVGQHERAQKVCPEGHLKAVHGIGAVLDDCPGVVDQNVDVTVELVGECAHRRQIGKVKFGDRGGAADLGGALRAQVCVADGEDHVCARACQ